MKHIAYIPYLVYVALLFIVLILLSFPVTLILLLFPERVRDGIMFGLLKTISNLWFILSGMWPRNFHRHKVDFNESYIITPNHQSFMDAAIIYTSIPQVFKTLGKKEIERIPIYGIIYKLVVITVDRSSLSARALSFRRMKQELDKGHSIVIFPEGTFPDHRESTLNEFQDGAFSLAVQQQKKILPLLFIDTSYRLHPSKLWQFTPGWNRAVYLPPLSTSGLEKNQVVSLKNYTRQYMQACLDHCRSNTISAVWDFGLVWQQKNSIA
jgi:1-acyl-sn-glycerol-3-phosphate acyltransferase